MIETFHLTRKFGSFNAVDDLSLQIEEGSVFGFLGPNGAGKTTTIRMLCGIIAPTSGYAVIHNIRADKEVELLHTVIGISTEYPGFYERMSARENLMYIAGFYDIDAKAQVEKYLRITGLWDRKEEPVGTFSKGMKQRMSLVRALLHEPKVLFLDEPTAGLDPESARDIRTLIRDIKEEGRTVFLSTHNLNEAEELCDRIAVFRNKLVGLDTPAGLRERIFRKKIVLELEEISADMMTCLSSLPFVKGVEQDGHRLIIEMESPDQNRPLLVQEVVALKGKMLSLYEEKHSLEDVYLKLIREEENHG
jgi:ABC-2 type transport system ATP-binding protein